ncbi:MAG: hypothetical protein JXL80_11220 [Planctomycetes bacterium]|nr:hypothetical protein [Planctomycetota bacterium]
MAKKAELRIGAARREISPDEPQLMKPTGMERLEPTRGVLDALYVEALAMETGGEPALLLTSDLRIVPNEWAQEVRREVGRRCGCDEQRVILSAVHNHCSSPEPADESPEAQAATERANRKIIDAMIAACVEAFENRRPAEIAYAETVLREPIGLNRRVRLSNGTCVNCWHAGGVCPPGLKYVGPGGPDSKDIQVLAVREVGARRPFAVMTSYATHPHLTAIPYFSGEFPGEAKREVARRLGGDPVILYANHCGGDNDLHVVQPEPDHPTEKVVQWFQASQRKLAGRFADAVVPAVEAAGGWTRPTDLRHAYWSCGEDDPTGKTRMIVVAALALGDVAFASIPGELFLELGQRLKAESPFAKLLAVGYNAMTGSYLPLPVHFEQGSYEVMRGAAADEDEVVEVRPGRFARRPTPDLGASVIDRALELLAELK